MDKFAITGNTEAEAIAWAKELKRDNPKTDYYVLLSRGKYYIEEAAPMIRNFETLVFTI